MDCKFPFIILGKPSSVSLRRISDGAYTLSIPDETEIKQPIGLILNDLSENLEIFLTIEIGKNSKATIIERFQNKKDQTLYYQHQIDAGENSDLKLITFQNLAKGSKLTEIREVRAAQSAHVHCFSFQLGAKQVRSSLKQNALGESGDLNIDFLCRTQQNQDYHFNLSNTYSARNGHGKILTKGIAMDESSLSFTGTIEIDQKGGGTDSYLKQDSLLLDKGAVIKTTPGLKINTNDVKAGHGASVINLNDESLFYLTSRGIDKESAKKMMINGFVAEQLDKINELPSLKEEIQRII